MHGTVPLAFLSLLLQGPWRTYASFHARLRLCAQRGGHLRARVAQLRSGRWWNDRSGPVIRLTLDCHSTDRAIHHAKTLREHDDKRVVQAWFTGLNPDLDDRVPIRLIREEDLEIVGPEILRAARSFVAGG